MKYLLMSLLLLSGCNETRLIQIRECVPFDELCNGLDDDCDGIVDNADKLEIKPCYSGNLATLAYGVCHFGVERCVNGEAKCSGEVLPKEEMCNSLDDDCDGLVDEGFESHADIIFVMDYSGSMGDKLERLINVVSQWGAKYGTRTDVKIALVAAPSYDIYLDNKVSVISNLTDINTFIGILTMHRTVGPASGEATLDAIYLISDPTNTLAINWTPNATRAIFLFTDEIPQSFILPEISESESKAKAEENNVKVFIFTTDNSWYRWNMYPLETSVSVLSNNIDDAISRSICK